MATLAPHAPARPAKSIAPDTFERILAVGAIVLLAAVAVTRARTHNVAAHRRGVRGMVTGALLIAGFFTFPFDRLLGPWLFS